MTFGAALSFGRICPGRWLALRSLFLNISSTLAVFDIEAPVGEKIEPKFHETHIRYVMRFFGVPGKESRLERVTDSLCVREGIRIRSSV